MCESEIHAEKTLNLTPFGLLLHTFRDIPSPVDGRSYSLWKLGEFDFLFQTRSASDSPKFVKIQNKE